MITIHFVNRQYISLSYEDWLEVKRAISAKEKFVRLYDDKVEFINLDMITHIINADEGDN